jgi:two-component system, response regulator PdtaR
MMTAFPLRVLVVDDHSIIAAGIACLLEELGHNVVDIAGTPEEAISSAERYKPDFIVMDVRLSGKRDGIDAAHNIREQFGVRSIFFSGYLDRETRERAEIANPIALLDKTASRDDFACAVSALACEARQLIS